MFRACYGKFIECIYKEKHASRARLETSRSSNRSYNFGRKDEEYAADFFLVSRRYLAPVEFRVFRYHLLLGADWKLCARRLQIDRGEFFHILYRIEQRLGRVFRELQPYPLFPLDEYFTAAGRAVAADASRAKARDWQKIVEINASRGRKKGPKPLRPPVRKVA